MAYLGCYMEDLSPIISWYEFREIITKWIKVKSKAKSVEGIYPHG